MNRPNHEHNDVQLPTFIETVKNQTVITGRSAILTCLVRNLGNYKVDITLMININKCCKR